MSPMPTIVMLMVSSWAEGPSPRDLEGDTRLWVLGRLLQASSLAFCPQLCCCSMMSPTRPPLTTSRSVASFWVRWASHPSPTSLRQLASGPQRVLRTLLTVRRGQAPLHSWWPKVTV